MVAATFPVEQNCRDKRRAKSFEKAKLDVVPDTTLVFECMEIWQFKDMSICAT